MERISITPPDGGTPVLIPIYHNSEQSEIGEVGCDYLMPFHKLQEPIKWKKVDLFKTGKDQQIGRELPLPSKKATESAEITSTASGSSASGQSLNASSTNSSYAPSTFTSNSYICNSTECSEGSSYGLVEPGHENSSTLTRYPIVLPNSANGRALSLLSYAVAQGDCHGYALVINNIHIDGREERQGAQHDSSKLSKTLKSLGYKLIGDKVHENCTAYRMKQLFEEAMAKDHTKHDSFICCLLSHGDTDYIYGTDDQKVWLSDLVKYATKCKSLVGKPKIFFVQACRGTLLPDARRVQVDGDGILQGRIFLPEACDVFIGYATSPNTQACRFTDVGSWYIIELCKAFEQYPQEDLMTIVQNAQYYVCTREEYHLTRDENGVRKTYRQSPQFVSSLIKKFYFY